MSRIAIITDSTANLPGDLIERYQIGIAPQVLIWEGETFYDEVDITADEFYKRLQTSDEVPTTSQATIASFLELFEPHVKVGNPIVAILVSDELSGTIQSAVQAKESFPGAIIEIIDSRSIAMAMGFQVLAAARAAEEGRSFNEVVDVAEQAKDRTGVVFVVDTLEYLHKGGRIGGAANLLGTALSLKPLLQVNDGIVDSLERVRTKAKACDRLIDIIDERVSDQQPVRIAALHAASLDEAEALLDKTKDRCNPDELMITDVGPVVGTHAGPGTVGIAYCAGI
ncbi:MAG: DegV family EDD domain-containing protein [Anaerolineales bacterium]|nr:DegV family EDD domain-containing protein [Anaerolineales bacterium]